MFEYWLGMIVGTVIAAAVMQIVGVHREARLHRDRNLWQARYLRLRRQMRDGTWWREN